MTATPSQMRPEELPLVLGWAADEGWNPGQADAAAFFAADPQGFFVSRIGDDPVAAISVVNHTDDFAFLGLYLCLPPWRGKGIGKALWDHAMGHAGERSIGLDGVPEQQANYAASGFEPAEETARFTGILPDEPSNLEQARASDLHWMAAKEAKACGYDKARFLAGWLADDETRRTYVLADQRGFATVRRCKSGAKIGPLVADDPQGAQDLLAGLAATFHGPVSIDLPRANAPLASYAAARGMTCDFKTARMYRGPAPTPGNLNRAVATMELG